MDITYLIRTKWIILGKDNSEIEFVLEEITRIKLL